MTTSSHTQKLPEFASYEDEARFWDTHDLTDFGPMEETSIEFVPRLNRSLNVRFDNRDVQRLRQQSRRLGVNVSTLVRMIVRQYMQRGNSVQAAQV